MKAFVHYQIEVAICMAAFSLLYILLWSRETNFTFKRYLLLFIPLCSIIIPLISFNIDLNPAQESPAIDYIIYLPNQLEMVYTPILAKTETLSGWEIAFWIFIAGVFLMLMGLLISYIRIIQIYRRSTADASGEFRTIDDPVHSFSFFNMMLINHAQASSVEKEYILAHEKAHKNQGHSWDILWLEIVKILHWFNPVIWFLTRESKKNLEYLADQEVALQSDSTENYQYAIVQHASQSGYQLLKTQFSKTNLRRRIIMMSQPNNHKITSWKLFAALPVLVVLFMSFSLKIDSLDLKKELTELLPVVSLPSSEIDQPEKLESIKLTQKVDNSMISIPVIAQSDTAQKVIFSVVEDQPTPTTGSMDAYFEKIQNDLHYPEEAKTNGVKGKVFVQLVVNKDGSLSDIKAVKGIGYGCDEAAVEAIKNGPAWKAGKQRGEKVNVRMILPIQFGKYQPKDERRSEHGQEDSTPQEVFTIVEEQPKPSTGDMDSYYKAINNNLNYPEEAQKNGVKGKVFVQFIVNKDGSLSDVVAIKGIHPTCDAEAVRVIREGPKWTPGEQKGKKVNVRMIMPVAFGIKYPPSINPIKGIVKNSAGEPIAGCNVIIEGTNVGTITNQKGQFQIKPEHGIKIINLVFSSPGYITEKRQAPYGSSHAIELKRIDENSLDESKLRSIWGIIKTEDGEPVIGCNILIKGTTTGTVTDVNGNFLLKIEPEYQQIVVSKVGYEIKKLDIIDGKKYDIILARDSEASPQSKNTTKEGQEFTLRANQKNFFDSDKKPLFILDGKEIDSLDLQSINPQDIESISVLKYPSASNLYGEKGKYGVIIINSKDDARPAENELAVRGLVTDENGNPVPVANVIIKGTSSGTITDKYGRYHINVNKEYNALIFSSMDLKQKEVKINGRSEIDVTLKIKK